MNLTRQIGASFIGQAHVHRILQPRANATAEQLRAELKKTVGPNILVGWRLALTLICITAAIIIIGVVFLVEGIYQQIWTSVSVEPFTYTMQRTPWLYVVPTGLLVTFLGTVLPFHYSARAIVIFVVYLLGFVGGHVLWCGCRAVG